MPDITQDLAALDEGEVGADRLYRLWETNHWSATELDFTQDIQDWRTRLTDAQRQAFMWFAAQFLDGEEAVTVTLAPFMEPLHRYEDRVFLATQIADEARHHVFFDRFLCEVVGIGNDYATTLAAVRPELTYGYSMVFGELDRIADRLRRFPRDQPLLAQGIMLYHVLIEAMIAHTGQHFLREFCTAAEVLPGFRQGILAVARDESRHIAFGVRALRGLVADSEECRRSAIAMVNRMLPFSAGGFVPPNLDWTLFDHLGFSGRELYTFSIRSLRAKLPRVGIAPEEVLQLAKLGLGASPVEQVDRLMDLIEGGAISGRANPSPTETTMNALFAATRDTALFTQSGEQGSIQWVFPDLQPRYLELRGAEEPVVGTGFHPAPRLTMRCRADDWVRIATGRLGQPTALITRRLKLEGDLRFALRLPQILPV